MMSKLPYLGLLLGRFVLPDLEIHVADLLLLVPELLADLGGAALGVLGLLLL